MSERVIWYFLKVQTYHPLVKGRKLVMANIAIIADLKLPVNMFEMYIIIISCKRKSRSI